MTQMAMTLWSCALTCAVGQATEPPRAVAEISGRVLDDATYEPLANVRVLIMSQGAILAGRVFDQSGNPLRSVFVGALRVDGALRLDQVKPSVATVRTNDAGQFQLQSLQPGQYAVVANRTSGRIGVEGNGARDSMTYFPRHTGPDSRTACEGGPSSDCRWS
jgi:protocatechuate 3,4-dioxygenase beta subunit